MAVLIATCCLILLALAGGILTLMLLAFATEIWGDRIR
jgi:hypothetical protein